MSQTRAGSFLESWANVAAGYTINLVANALIFPLFGLHITLADNLKMGVIYTVISVARSYGLRRLFNRIKAHHAPN